MSEDTSQPDEANSKAVTDAATTAAAAEIAPAPEVVSPEADPAGATGAATAAPDAVRNLFGALDADQRIRTVVKQNEHTLWAGAAAVTLIYVGIIALQVMQLSPAELAEMAKRKRGQDAPESISVDLVPDPDKTSKTQKWQEGADRGAEPGAAAASSSSRLRSRACSSRSSRRSPSRRIQRQRRRQSPRTKPSRKRMLPRPRRRSSSGRRFPISTPSSTQPQPTSTARSRMRWSGKSSSRGSASNARPPHPGGALQIRGTGASGRSDPFSRSVIAALMKTRPGPFALWGRVLVSFQISESGQVAYVHLLQSSGNTALDQAAINAIRKAQFERPPTGLSPDDRTYIIDYIFG